MIPSHVLVAAAGDYAIPLAALIVAAASLLISSLRGGRADRDHAMTELREELKECKSQRSALERENVALLRELAGKADIRE